MAEYFAATEGIAVSGDNEFFNLVPRRRIERPTYPLGGDRSIH